MKRPRRTFIAEFKAKVAIEVIKELKTTPKLAQIYQVLPNLIGLWMKEFQLHASKVFDRGKEEVEQLKKL